jgi:hypothetical protein
MTSTSVPRCAPTGRRAPKLGLAALAIDEKSKTIGKAR